MNLILSVSTWRKVDTQGAVQQDVVLSGLSQNIMQPGKPARVAASRRL